MARTKNRHSKSDEKKRSQRETEATDRELPPAEPPRKRPWFLLATIGAMAIWVVFLLVAVASVWR